MKKVSSISAAITIKDFHLEVVESIKAFMKQTRPPNEIVIVGPKDVLKRIKEKVKGTRIIGLRLVNFEGGKNEARNKSVDETNGKFVLFVDHDMIPFKNLIEESIKLLDTYDALVIPEKGSGNKISDRILKLEKEIAQTDPGAITPRLFKKSLFKIHEKPFDSKFGILDEWGFNIRLRQKNAKIGTVNSKFIVKEKLYLFERMHKNYEKGIFAKILINEDRDEGLRRVNPIKRGLVVYTKNTRLFKRQPLIFLALVFLRIIDFSCFCFGFLKSTLED